MAHVRSDPLLVYYIWLGYVIKVEFGCTVHVSICVMTDK